MISIWMISIWMIGGWNTSFIWDGLFSGAALASGRECFFVSSKLLMVQKSGDHHLRCITL